MTVMSILKSLGLGSPTAVVRKMGGDVEKLYNASTTMKYSQTRRLPELKTLIDLARSYLADEVHFSHVCGASIRLSEAVKIHIVDARILKIAQEWEIMSLRVWPEMAQVENPISLSEFRKWVSLQLQVSDVEPLR